MKREGEGEREKHLSNRSWMEIYLTQTTTNTKEKRTSPLNAGDIHPKENKSEQVGLSKNVDSFNNFGNSKVDLVGGGSRCGKKI